MKKIWFLPAAAAVAAAAALVTFVMVSGRETGAQAGSSAQQEGRLVIQESGLSSDKVSFIRVDDSKIELLARIGDDRHIKVALGTCQSCKGSPWAYYTQRDDQLMCNNCGLTFALSVLDAPGGGCHPITLDSSIIKETEGQVEISLDALRPYEYLFEKVESH